MFVSSSFSILNSLFLIHYSPILAGPYTLDSRFRGNDETGSWIAQVFGIYRVDLTRGFVAGTIVVGGRGGRMTQRQLLALVCLVSFVWVTMVSPFIGTCSADATGDNHVNILDVQTLVSEVFTGHDSTAQTDVNSDGEVNILDFQHMVFHTSRPALFHLHHPCEEDELPPRVSPREPGHFFCCQALARLDRYVTSRVVLEPSQRVYREVSMTRSSLTCRRTERYLYRLTPNAPPFCA